MFGNQVTCDEGDGKRTLGELIATNLKGETPEEYY